MNYDKDKVQEHIFDNSKHEPFISDLKKFLLLEDIIPFMNDQEHKITREHCEEYMRRMLVVCSAIGQCSAAFTKPISEGFMQLVELNIRLGRDHSEKSIGRDMDKDATHPGSTTKN